MIRSSITLTELAKIFSERVKRDVPEYGCEIVEVENQNIDGIIGCRILGIEFIIIPQDSGPFHESFLLSRIFPAHIDPEVLCAEFNRFTKFASATPVTIESEDGDDDSDEVMIDVEKLVILKGGVTDEHIAETLNLWIDMLVVAKYRFEGVKSESTESDD